MIYELAEDILQPPERITVSQAAEKYVKLNNPGSYSGKWSNAVVPYMVEPQDMCASREKQGVVFVGPSQSSKTASLVLNFIAYTVVCDPMDIIVYEKSMTAAKDFSIRRVDRMHRDSPDVRQHLVAFGKSGDNVFDKIYRNGVLLSLSYPSINEMSGRPVPRVVLTDYDRMNEDVDGEGSPFDVARARIRTFRSAGKIVAESSPSRDQIDPHWQKSKVGQQEGPPVTGIVSLYNRGDRRRWHWPCPHCKAYFEGSFSLLTWSGKDSESGDIDIDEAANSSQMMCPHCAALIDFNQRKWMNARGHWLGPGQRIENGRRVGKFRESDIASYWLKGPAAAFSTWAQLVRKWIEAEREYANTGDQLALKTTTNTDQSEVWTPRGVDTLATPEELQSQALPLPKREVPQSVRFLLAQIDVQGGHWVVQVFGVQPSEVGFGYDIVYIDRFKIDRAERLDENGDKMNTRPSANPEDWDLITEQVIDKKYPISGTNSDMGIWHVVCDSAGKKGATANAYAYWLRLRKAGKHKRFMLCKGDKNPECPRVHIEMPDAQRKDRLAQARGEIPLMFFNSNTLKDAASGMLMRTEPGGRVYFPEWFPDYVYQELTVEVRGPKGWVNERQKRNEAWDLLYYGIGQLTHLKIEHMDWENSPTWAKPWAENSVVTSRFPTGNDVATAVKKVSSLSSLAESLG